MPKLRLKLLGYVVPVIPRWTRDRRATKPLLKLVVWTRDRMPAP